MRNLAIIGLLCISALLIGAWLYFGNGLAMINGQSGATASTQNPQEKKVSFKIIGQGDTALAMTARKNYAIYDPTEFTNFWKKAHGTDTTPAPVVDFGRNYVIAVFAGTEPTGGYTIGVKSITDAGTARSVAVVIEQPGPDCPVVEEQSSPFQFVVVSLSDNMALAHTDVVEQKHCK